MDGLLGFIIGMGAIYAAYRFLEKSLRNWQEASARNALGRKLQHALQAMGKDPDFRRAATNCGECAALPADFRRRQFARFRPMMVDICRSRLSSGIQESQLRTSLASLAMTLGVPAFEAEYVMTEALESSTTRGRGLQDVIQEHERRREGIRWSSGLDETTIQELLEAEELRFRDELFRVAEGRDPWGQPQSGARS